MHVIRFAQRCAELTVELNGNEEFDLHDQLLEEKQKSRTLQRRLENAQHEIMDLLDRYVPRLDRRRNFVPKTLPIFVIMACRVSVIDAEITRAQRQADPSRELSDSEREDMQRLAQGLLQRDEVKPNFFFFHPLSLTT